MQTSVVHGWRCRYDLQTGKFDVPPVFSAGNAKAVMPSRREAPDNRTGGKLIDASRSKAR